MLRTHHINVCFYFSVQAVIALDDFMGLYADMCIAQGIQIEKKCEHYLDELIARQTLTVCAYKIHIIGSISLAEFYFLFNTNKLLSQWNSMYSVLPFTAAESANVNWKVFFAA